MVEKCILQSQQYELEGLLDNGIRVIVLSSAKTDTAYPMRHVPRPMLWAASKIFWVARRASSIGQDPPGLDPTMITAGTP